MPILEMITNHPSIRSVLTSRAVQALAAPKGTDKIGQDRILGIAQAAVTESFGPDAKVKRDMFGLLHFTWLDAARSRIRVSSTDNGGL